MKLTARQLNRATLARQMLLAREPVSVVEAVHRIVAVQAQEAASPYIALWNRISGFDPADLDAAFTDHRVVKASLMRITLHAVTADDHPAFHHAMQTTLRAGRLGDPRFTRSGVTIAEADAFVPQLVAFAERARTVAEFEAMIHSELGIPPGQGVWWALRTYAPLVHAPTGASWSFGPRPSYAAARTRRWPGPVAESTGELIRRYLSGFGPATAQDFSQFAMIRQPAVRAGLQALAGTLVEFEGPGGVRLYDVPGAPLPDEDVPAPARLMAMWDSTLLAYVDRSRVIPPDYRRLIIRQNGDVLPTMLVDGRVAGVWRPVEEGIQAIAFHPLSARVWRELDTEARGLIRFLVDRDPVVYRRYQHWWAALPAGEVRVLAGSTAARPRRS